MLSSKELPELINEKIDLVIPKENRDNLAPSPHTSTLKEVKTPVLENNISEKANLDIKSDPPIVSNQIKDTPEKEKEVKINIASPQHRVSGLSLSSLRIKKEHQLNKREDVVDESKLPKSSFTEEDMQKHWTDFVHQIDTQGRKILASNLNTDIPKLRDSSTIWIELPNGTMKKEIEREQFDLIEYLRLKLDNHFIKLKITINESTAKKFAFTPEEKYEKLRERNPAIDILRREFDLDL